MKTDDVLDALKQCVSSDTSCEVCPLICCFGCRQVLLAHALETINSQKAEIERLEAGRRADSEAILSLNHELLHIRTKAIKEFADRMKEKAKMPLGTLYGQMVYAKDIDNLVKEMTEVHDEP